MSLFKDSFTLCMFMASLIFLLCQFSSLSRIFTSLIEHWWPVFNLCMLSYGRCGQLISANLCYIGINISL